MSTRKAEGRGTTIEIECLEFATSHEAIQHTEADGRGEAIRLGGKYLVVSREDADRLAALGAAFAYLCDHEGQIMSVPVNG
jgi:hypothetical protein